MVISKENFDPPYKGVMGYFSLFGFKTTCKMVKNRRKAQRKHMEVTCKGLQIILGEI